MQKMCYHDTVLPLETGSLTSFQSMRAGMVWFVAARPQAASWCASVYVFIVCRHVKTLKTKNTVVSQHATCAASKRFRSQAMLLPTSGGLVGPLWRNSTKVSPVSSYKNE